jgi:precorrin-6A/cobalt-precorrin-6A reductase
MRILIFGGTNEAIKIAEQLGDNHQITTSLAGRTKNPKLPKHGEIRTGGFGGVENLNCYFIDEGFDFIIDATHPYAKNISNQIIKAAGLAGKKLLRFVRPSWQISDGVKWEEVENFTVALERLPKEARVFVTTGHKELEKLESRQDCFFLVRLIEPPAISLSDNISVIISRPPYNFESEIKLLEDEKITHLVTKNSGSSQTKAKIDAALKLGVNIIMLERPVITLSSSVFAKEFSDIKIMIEYLTC